MSLPALSQQDIDLVTGCTQELWPALRGKQLFITGGTGFFGRWLLETFVAANDRFALGAHATVLTRSKERFTVDCPHLATHPAITLHHGDMQSFAFPEGAFPFVIHAATDVSAARDSGHGPQANLLSAIFDGTRRTLEFAASHGTRRFLMVSSGAVYGPQPSPLSHIPETYRGAPDTCAHASAYGEGKRASETLCVQYNGQAELNCVIARPFAFAGPHLALDQGFAIGDFIRSAMASEPIQIRGDGTAMRSYLYAADLAIWLWTILFRATPLTPYNVGSSQAVSIRGLAEEVAAVLSPGLPIHVAENAKPGASPMQYVPDVQRAAADLGLCQTVNLRDAIRRTAAWHGWKAADSALQKEGLNETHQYR